MKTLITTVWVLISMAHPGKQIQPQTYLGVYATEAACEHMLAALSDPTFALKTAKPTYMTCIAEEPQS